VLDLRSLGPLHRARAPPVASPALSATSVGFPAVSLRRQRAWVHAPQCLGVFFFFFSGLGFFGSFFCSCVLGFIRVLLLFGCLMGAFTVLGFGGSRGFWGF